MSVNFLHPQKRRAQPVPTNLAFEQTLCVPERVHARAGVSVASAGRRNNPVVGHAGIIVDVKPQGSKQGISMADIREVHFPEVHIEGYGQA